MALPVNLMLRRLGEGLRTRRNKIVQQRLPWRFLDLLCRLDEREEGVIVRAGDRVRLAADGRVLTVVEQLDTGQVTCEDVAGGRRIIVSARDLDVIEPGGSAPGP
jgi:hypothetical protein